MIRVLIAALSSLGILWHPVRDGVSLSEVMMSDRGALSKVRAVMVRMNRSSHRLSLATQNSWTIDSVSYDAVVAFNAGQFSSGIPWGWVVQEGREIKPPGSGALSMALIEDSGGTISLVTPREIASLRGQVRNAFQSYPTLIVDGELPWELRAAGRGVDLTHRDSRLAICMMDDESLVVVLTRFTALGPAGATLPWGPTIPEMADYMLGLGCRRAMMLDGGMSSQLVVRNGDGSLNRWPNWRPVPLAMIIKAVTTSRQ